MEIFRKVIIERRGKKPVGYNLIQYIGANTYLAVKSNGGERPKKVFLIELTEEDII